MQSCQSSYFNYIHCCQSTRMSTLCPHWLIDLSVRHSFYTVLCSFHPTSILNVRCKQALSNIRWAVSGLGSNRQLTRSWWVCDQATFWQSQEYRSTTATTARSVETNLNLEASTRQLRFPIKISQNCLEPRHIWEIFQQIDYTWRKMAEISD